MNKLQKAIVWLSRIRHCRGFGIQSPWAYSFACNVINNHAKLKAYAQAEQNSMKLNSETVKLGRLYLRLCQHIKPQTVYYYGTNGDTYHRYVKAGCATSEFISSTVIPTQDFPTLNNDTHTAPTITIIGRDIDYQDILNKVIDGAIEDSVIVIEGIKKNKKARSQWLDVVENLGHTVTFDLYYCGLACVKHKMYKQNYIVNF